MPPVDAPRNSITLLVRELRLMNTDSDSTKEKRENLSDLPQAQRGRGGASSQLPLVGVTIVESGVRAAALQNDPRVYRLGPSQSHCSDSAHLSTAQPCLLAAARHFSPRLSAFQGESHLGMLVGPNDIRHLICNDNGTIVPVLRDASEEGTVRGGRSMTSGCSHTAGSSIE